MVDARELDMTRAAPGLMAFHNAAPYEFLYLIRRGVAGEVWRVRPIFCEPAPERDVLVRTGDRLTPIHGSH